MLYERENCVPAGVYQHIPVFTAMMMMSQVKLFRFVFFKSAKFPKPPGVNYNNKAFGFDGLHCLVFISQLCNLSRQWFCD